MNQNGTQAALPACVLTQYNLAGKAACVPFMFKIILSSYLIDKI